MRIKGQFIVLMIASAFATGCVTTAAFPPMMHPSQQGNVNAAGIGMGANWSTAAGTDDGRDDSLLQLPYGEGWARFGVGTGQIELRVTPALGFAGYRLNIMSAQEDGIGIAVKPSLGLGYWNASRGSGELSDSFSQLALAPNISMLFSFVDGDAYVAPRLGYLHLMSFDDNDDSTGMLSFGANVGYIIDSDPFDYSLEIGFQRVTSTEDGAYGPAYMVVPSVGIQL